jgi:WD40 repeat protein
VWDARTGALIADLTGHTAAINRVAFAPDGRRILSCGQDQMARVWDLAEARVLLAVDMKRGSGDCAFSPDGALIATTGGGIRLWNAIDGRLLAVFEEYVRYHANVARPDSIQFTADGRALIAANGDTAQIWALERETRPHHALAAVVARGLWQLDDASLLPNPKR